MPSAVVAADTSLVLQSVIQPSDESEHEICTNGSWLKGVCQHGNTRWIKVPCKRRSCEVCGLKRRRKIAWRIAYGVEVLGGEKGAGWLVGTFNRDICKAEAIKVLAKMIRWVRKELGVHIEYAATWEFTKNRRLHVNVIMAPWVYVPQGVLSERWERFGGGKRVWIERVGTGIGQEAAKSREKIGNYFSKWEQMVEEGRGIAYSRNWPQLPDSVELKRKGDILWRFMKVTSNADDGADMWAVREFEGECAIGYWVEVGAGEWMWALGEDCDCFQRAPPGHVEEVNHG